VRDAAERRCSDQHGSQQDLGAGQLFGFAVRHRAMVANLRRNRKYARRRIDNSLALGESRGFAGGSLTSDKFAGANLSND
jgi:hypothetical protein